MIGFDVAGNILNTKECERMKSPVQRVESPVQRVESPVQRLRGEHRAFMETAYGKTPTEAMFVRPTSPTLSDGKEPTRDIDSLLVGVYKKLSSCSMFPTPPDMDNFLERALTFESPNPFFANRGKKGMGSQQQ